MRIYDAVTVIVDLPEHNLRAGQVGTVIEEWDEGVYEVEFADVQGVPYAMVVLKTEQLMQLFWQPAAQGD